MSNFTKAIAGRELFEYLQCRFNMTETQALASMRKHNQDMSFLAEEKGTDNEEHHNKKQLHIPKV